jgi:hypothetical protein
MTTTTTTIPTAALDAGTAVSARWRPLLVAGGLVMALAGPLHPESDASGSTREELAEMTAGATWVASHTGTAVGTALLAAGLWAASRSGRWPAATHKALRVAAIAVSVYVLETVMHLAAVLDRDALAAGDPAPIAFTHLGLAAVLYPISGLAVSALAARLFRASAGANRVFAAVGVVAGLLHAVSVPLTLVAPDFETTPIFAAAGTLLAAWALGLGIAGIRAARPVDAAPA